MIVAISGGFDPIHIGHIRLIESAVEYGDVIVILNSDDWLKRKKGYLVMKWEDRSRILHAIKGVKQVRMVDDDDGTVCEALTRIKPDYFANGGDRTIDSTPEIDLCRKLGIRLLFGIGGEKSESSQEIINRLKDSHLTTQERHLQMLRNNHE